MSTMEALTSRLSAEIDDPEEGNDSPLRHGLLLPRPRSCSRMRLKLTAVPQRRSSSLRRTAPAGTWAWSTAAPRRLKCPCADGT